MRPLNSKTCGGSLSLGEMELQQMYANGFTNLLSEFVMKSDTVVVPKCIDCNFLSIFCKCNNELSDGK